jgi:hypothetical protein
VIDSVKLGQIRTAAVHSLFHHFTLLKIKNAAANFDPGVVPFVVPFEAVVPQLSLIKWAKLF